MVNYYLTEMNNIKLENCLLQFIYKQQLSKTLVNGVTIKVISMMYLKGIDYYYPDLLATKLDVDYKYVDKIYIHNQSKYYEDPLSKLLSKTDYKGTSEDAQTLEKEVNQILETKKRIHTNKNYKKSIS